MAIWAAQWSRPSLRLLQIHHGIRISAVGSLRGCDDDETFDCLISFMFTMTFHQPEQSFGSELLCRARIEQQRLGLDSNKVMIRENQLSSGLQQGLTGTRLGLRRHWT